MTSAESLNRARLGGSHKYPRRLPPFAFLTLQIFFRFFILLCRTPVRLPTHLDFDAIRVPAMADSPVELPGRLAILPFRNKVLLPGAIVRIRCTNPSR